MEHDCRTCPERATCIYPYSFNPTLGWNGTELAASPPELTPFLAGEHGLPNLQLFYEEVRVPEGRVFAFIEGIPRGAFLFPKTGGIRILDPSDLALLLGIEPPTKREILLGSIPSDFFGDTRPLTDRFASLFSWVLTDDPEGNRLIIASRSVRDGLLLRDEYLLAVKGWQAFPEPLEQKPLEQEPLSFQNLFGDLFGSLPEGPVM